MEKAIELILFAENDRQTYSQHLLPNYIAVERRMAMGGFKHNIAMSSFNRSMKQVAYRYNREFGGVFTPSERKAAALLLLEACLNELKSGNSWIN